MWLGEVVKATELLGLVESMDWTAETRDQRFRRADTYVYDYSGTRIGVVGNVSYVEATLTPMRQID